MKYWEIIVNNMSKAGFRLGCVSALYTDGPTIWVVAAERETETFRGAYR